MFLPGLLLSNRLLGAVTTFGGVAAAVWLSVTTFNGVAAAICLRGLLSAANGDEMFGNRSSVCWSVGCCRFVGCPSKSCFLAAAAVTDGHAPWFRQGQLE
jgi:hypothetical protein